MHMAPDVPNYGRSGRGPRLSRGMCLAIEPMLTLGTEQTITLDDDWTVVTADSSRAAHWENTIAITTGRHLGAHRTRRWASRPRGARRSIRRPRRLTPGGGTRLRAGVGADHESGAGWCLLSFVPSPSQPAGTSPALASDLEIARSTPLVPIGRIAEAAGIPEGRVEPYGRHVAKIDLGAVGDLAGRPPAKYIVVTAVTPTPLGEGKTTTAVGLAQGLAQLGTPHDAHPAPAVDGPDVRRQGWRGGSGACPGAADGTDEPPPHGRLPRRDRGAQPAPAMVDNHLHHGNELGIEPHSISWRRVLDVNDRPCETSFSASAKRRTACRGSRASTSPRPVRWVSSWPWRHRCGTCVSGSAGSSSVSPATGGR